MAWIALIGLLLGSCATDTHSTDGADVPVQEIQYSWVEGSERLDWIDEHSDAVLTARLVAIEAEAFSRYDPESMDDIERVYRGLVFQPVDGYRGMRASDTSPIVVLDPALDRNRVTGREISQLRSAAFPFDTSHIGSTFVLFLSESRYSPGNYVFASMRYGTIEIVDDRAFRSHTDDDPESPWRKYVEVGWQKALDDLGLTRSRIGG